jgi:PAS domain S-box-containing protein
MWTFREHAAIFHGRNWGKSSSFRIRLTLVLTLVVFSVTVLALYYAQWTQQVAYQRNFQDKFQSRLGYLLGLQEARQDEVSQQCRSLAKSVRIQAALEEQDMEDLYAIAKIELGDVLDDGSGKLSNRPGTPPRATFFRFLTADGKLLQQPGAASNPEPWDAQLLAASIGTGSQQIGYLAITDAKGEPEISEVVATPILGMDGERLAALVLGFPSNDFIKSQDADLRTGVLLNGQLHLSGLTSTDSDTLATTIKEFIQTSPETANNFSMKIHGEPYLLFYKILNPGSQFPPAYEISLYSLADSVARRQQARWEILGVGALVLVLGMGGSHFFSTQLSRPVEQLEEVSAQNLAGRKQAEAAREVTEQKYRSIVENAVEGIFLLAPDGRYLSANPAMARIFGYDSPEHFIAELAEQPEELYLDPQRGNDFLRLAKTEGTVSNFECEASRKDGNIIWISQNARAVRDDDSGAVVHLEGTMEDITERKKAADSLKTLNAELEKALADLKATQNQVIQQERLRALGQMASGIAHDFNNSLMPVMGFTELLLSHPGILDDKKKATGYLETIRTAAQDAASIVARLREFYRSNEHSDVFTAVDLVHLARQAVSLTQPKWKGQAHASGIEIKVVEDLKVVPPISGDESALREVLTNLIFNAVDAMPQGGSITLRTWCEDDRALLDVSDSGAGMTEEVRQRCLEPFFTTKGERGTGLGLAMVFGIVQRHQGAIDLRTQLGEGTTFVLSFPLRNAATATAMLKTAQMPSLRPLRILLVDDEPQVRGVLAAFLEVDGHSVTCAEDGIGGLQLSREEIFDLVITDKAIPGMSGDQMALEIKRISPNMPIVMLSGFNAAGEKEVIPGVDVIASKPITMAALRNAIRKAMEAV